MARERAKWYTTETCKNYEFQTNQYEEVRILSYGKVFRTFNGYDCRITAKRWWNNIKSINA